MRLACLSGLVFAAIGPAFAADAPAALDRKPLEATTVQGEKVLLHPNGRWEFLDAKKAEEAKKVAEQYPENRTRPVDAQGGLAGFGRIIMPGDKDYNRGSLNPKSR